VQRRLADICYQHLGGEVIQETVTDHEAAVILKARIRAVDGASTQTELYRLRRLNGAWRIDALDVTEEVLERPGSEDEP
jgi:hypothetical protein